jgi:hypothetical protein
MSESLEKEAKRWLLRDVQLALARERGFPGWTDLTRAFQSKTPRGEAHANASTVP